MSVCWVTLPHLPALLPVRQGSQIGERFYSLEIVAGPSYPDKPPAIRFKEKVVLPGIVNGGCARVTPSCMLVIMRPRSTQRRTLALVSSHIHTHLSLLWMDVILPPRLRDCLIAWSATCGVSFRVQNLVRCRCRSCGSESRAFSRYARSYDVGWFG